MVSTDNKDSENDRVQQLRKKLAALRGEESEDNTTTSQSTSSRTKKPSQEDELEQLAQASEEERRRFAQQQNPRLRVQEERTHKLVAKQVTELIELTTELQKRIKKLEQENKNVSQELERSEKHNKEMREKMELIDGRLEKFMGLYEIITNQYNPFSDQQQTEGDLPSAPASTTQESQTLRVADDLGGQEQEVAYEQGQISSENKKKIDQLLAELQSQEHDTALETEEELEETQVREQEVTQSVESEIKELFDGFENRMKTYLDSSLQNQLHEALGDVEQVLSEEIHEAISERINDLLSHDDVVNSAFSELESLQQRASNPKEYAVVEHELEDDVRSIDDQIKSIPPSLYFRLHDGSVLKSKDDLKEALESMSDDVLNYHVGSSHNDFADWMELALEDPVGEKLRGKSRSQMIELLE